MSFLEMTLLGKPCDVDTSSILMCLSVHLTLSTKQLGGRQTWLWEAAYARQTLRRKWIRTLRRENACWEEPLQHKNTLHLLIPNKHRASFACNEWVTLL